MTWTVLKPTVHKKRLSRTLAALAPLSRAVRGLGDRLTQQQQIEKVARVLAQWNPLGPSAQNVPDLDCYRTEATDIIELRRGSGEEEKAVMNVLNQAFARSE